MGYATIYMIAITTPVHIKENNHNRQLTTGVNES